jgi:hypothetical protein
MSRSLASGSISTADREKPLVSQKRHGVLTDVSTLVSRASYQCTGSELHVAEGTVVLMHSNGFHLQGCTHRELCKN